MSAGRSRLGYLTRVVEQPLHRALGLTDGELDRICELLGRDPNHFELAVFSLLWSEHCGYKHSALQLKRLPSRGERVLQGPGENAGVLDLGDGQAVAFKVESHNHPSAVEPFQGAATGIGGILRDVIAMGARPIVLLDGLRFSEPGWMFERAVAGIGHYGNCLAPDEAVIFRNSGSVRATTIGELAEARTGAGDGKEWTARPTKPFQVLSIDPVTGEPVWANVSRLFKRQADRLIRIRAALGRTLTVTEDHPFLIWENEELVERPARSVRPGDLVPLLRGLPQADRTPNAIDLIEELDEPATVMLPKDWCPSAGLRKGLIVQLPRADRRFYWLNRRELPVAAFRALEADVGVERDHLQLRLAGPRSTPVPAVFPLNADTARLIGYFLSEGCSSRNGTTTKLIWTFGHGESDGHYIEDLTSILRRLGLRHSVERRRSTVAITVSSRLLGRLFEDVLECGTHAANKSVPSVLMAAPTSLRVELLKGIFRGDGSVDFPERGRARIRHATTSVVLHEQVLLLLQGLGIFASRHVRPASKREIDGRPVHAKESYHLEFHGHDQITVAESWFTPNLERPITASISGSEGSPFGRARAIRRGRLALVPVSEIEELNCPSAVYDFEVPGSHVFVTSGGILTHNCVGVPTVGGEAVFDEAYRGNCLVNAMCVGLLPTERVVRATASAPGRAIVLYGATTGRDGIGGASVLASQELGEEDANKRPTVQIGDPFTGKKLIEASQDLVELGLVDSLQDCGAAGLASALAEMARDGAGVDVELEHVPLREDDLEPWEIMISESQERMVCVTERVDDVAAVCRKWELNHAVIGEVTDTGELRAFHDGELVGEIPARLLTEECPRYRVPTQPKETAPASPPLEPNVRSRRWIYERYDQLVGSRTIRRPGLDAAVLRLRPSYRGLAVTLDGPPVGERDPFRAGALAVLDAARNVACVGGEPIGLTDCLNFGNPEKPEIAWELEQAIEGISQAAEALGIPVVSGNVSLYNDTDGRSIPPTPVVGCVGLVEDVRTVPQGWHPGDIVSVVRGPSNTVLLGKTELGYEAELIGLVWRAAPGLSLIHDVSDGGLDTALREMAEWSGVEAQLDVPDPDTVRFVLAGATVPDFAEEVGRV
jgi:phosphoribosylformylglycinamidine synthase